MKPRGVTVTIEFATMDEAVLFLGKQIGGEARVIEERDNKIKFKQPSKKKAVDEIVSIIGEADVRTKDPE